MRWMYLLCLGMVVVRMSGVLLPPRLGRVGSWAHFRVGRGELNDVDYWVMATGLSGVV